MSSSRPSGSCSFRWRRYLTALASRRLQSRLRRQVFAQAVRLPLHRLRAYQSGGLVSLLRDDVGGAAGLLSAMVFQPWRAFIQLLGTVVALGFIEWRAVAVVAVILLPLAYIPQRLWIRRMRPVWRDVRLLRRRIDAHVTEVFAGIRVIEFNPLHVNLPHDSPCHGGFSPAKALIDCIADGVMNAAKVNAEILLLALAIVIEAKGLRDAIKVMSKRFRVPSCIDVALDRV